MAQQIKAYIGTIGRQNIEPRANGWATLLGDLLALSGYTARYKFNDARARIEYENIRNVVAIRQCRVASSPFEKTEVEAIPINVV